MGIWSAYASFTCVMLYGGTLEHTICAFSFGERAAEAPDAIVRDDSFRHTSWTRRHAVTVID